MDQCIDFLGETRILSTLDVHSGYGQVEIDTHHLKTAGLTSYHHCYQFIRMASILKSALAALQRAMDVILFSAKQQSPLGCSEDIFVLLKGIERSLNRLQRILTLLHAAVVVA